MTQFPSNWPYSTDNMMPFIDLKVQEKKLHSNLQEAFESLMSSGSFIMGPKVEECELALSNLSGCQALTCASGTDALMLALMAINIGPGDAVFVPSFTFAASAEVIRLLGASPVFIDCTPDTFCLDINSLTEAYDMIIRDKKLTPKSLIAVDLFGHPVEYEPLKNFCEERHLVFIGDCAQSFGATYDTKPVTSLSHIATTSFYPAKPLSCYGDGGAVFVSHDQEELLNTLKSLRIHGQGNTRYEHIRIGLTGRMDALQAAFLLVKMGIFEEEVALRQKIADRYTTGLQDLEILSLYAPKVKENCTSVWAQYTLRVNNRNAFQEHLRSYGIPTGIYYPIPTHLQIAYKDDIRAPKGLPVTENLASQVVSLPIDPYISTSVQDGVIDIIKDFYKK